MLAGGPAAIANDESLFLASATGPEEGVGFDTVRVVLVELMLESLVCDGALVVVGRGEGLFTDVAGFRVAAVVVDDVGLCLLGEVAVPDVLAMVDVRREAAAVPTVEVRFFSSSDAEGADRVRPVVVVRFAAVVPPGGRVGGLVNPLLAAALVRVVELVVGLASEPVVAPGRRAPVAEVVDGFFTPDVEPSDLAPLASFFRGAVAAGVASGFASGWAAGASSR